MAQSGGGSHRDAPQQQQQQQPHGGSQQQPQQQQPTSRLCVKNIPKHLTEQRLKEHFGAKGQLTDVKILKTRCVRAVVSAPARVLLRLLLLRLLLLLLLLVGHTQQPISSNSKPPCPLNSSRSPRRHRLPTSLVN
jgi:hypothetical protein